MTHGGKNRLSTDVPSDAEPALRQAVFALRNSVGKDFWDSRQGSWETMPTAAPDAWDAFIRWPRSAIAVDASGALWILLPGEPARRRAADGAWTTIPEARGAGLIAVGRTVWIANLVTSEILQAGLDGTLISREKIDQIPLALVARELDVRALVKDRSGGCFEVPLNLQGRLVQDRRTSLDRDLPGIADATAVDDAGATYRLRRPRTVVKTDSQGRPLETIEIPTSPP